MTSSHRAQSRLLKAVYEKNNETLKEILTESPNSAHVTTAYAGHPFHIIAKQKYTQNNKNCFEKIYEAAKKTNYTFSNCFYLGKNPLHWAILTNNLELIQFILKTPELKKAWLNQATPKNKITPLHLAVSLKFKKEKAETNIQIIKLLIKNKADLKAVDHKGDTALHLLAQLGKKSEALETYLEHCEADVLDLKNKQGEIALHLACQHANFGKTLELLLTHGADPTIPNKKNKNAFQIARNTLSSASIIRALLLGGIGDGSNAYGALGDGATRIMRTVDNLGIYAMPSLKQITHFVCVLSVLGMSLFFIAACSREKRLKYGKRAQKNLTLRMENLALQYQKQKREAYEKQYQASLKKLIKINNTLQDSSSPKNRNKFIKMKTNSKTPLQYLKTTLIDPIKTIYQPIKKLKSFSFEKEDPLKHEKTAQDKRLALTTSLIKATGIFTMQIEMNFIFFGLSKFLLAPTVIAAMSGPVGWGLLAASIIVSVGFAAALGYLNYRDSLKDFQDTTKETHQQIKTKNKILDNNETLSTNLKTNTPETLKKVLKETEKLLSKSSKQKSNPKLSSHPNCTYSKEYLKIPKLKKIAQDSQPKKIIKIN